MQKARAVRRPVQRAICGGWVGKPELPAAAPIASSSWLKPQAPGGHWRIKVWFIFTPFCYFCSMAVIMDCALPSSAALGRAACDISQLGMPWLATCLLVKWKKYRWLTFWLRLLSQTAAYASQKTVTCFFSLFSYFYRPENPAASEWLKALS